MVASLIDTDTKVALWFRGGEKHVVDLKNLTEANLKKLKIAAQQNLLDVYAVRDQIYEFIRRINAVLDTRVNNAACLGTIVETDLKPVSTPGG